MCASRQRQIHKFVRATGRRGLNAPGRRTLRIEIPIGSALPGKVTELGCRMLAEGSTTRIERGKFVASPVIEVDLP
jgi:hypothetical protein